MFSIAGLYDSSSTPDGKKIVSCTIITVPANELLADIHNAKQRMPLVLTKEDVDSWLSGSLEQATLLRPFPPELMRAHPVSSRVNTPKNNDPMLIELVPED